MYSYTQGGLAMSKRKDSHFANSVPELLAAAQGLLARTKNRRLKSAVVKTTNPRRSPK
jgi:hypothetical protein